MSLSDRAHWYRDELDYEKYLLPQLKINWRNVNAVIVHDQSPLCHALQYNARLPHIKKLLDKGAKLNTCKIHNKSSLLCATESINSVLRADLISLLLNKCGPSINKLNDAGLSPLQLALGLCFKYETAAINLLLDLPGVDVNDTANDSGSALLHFAITNARFKLEVVESLINRGARLDIRDKKGNTPLHLAILYEDNTPSIIELLLEKGAPVNAEDNMGVTVLQMAVCKQVDENIMKMLLMAGAQIAIPCDDDRYHLAQMAVDNVNEHILNNVRDSRELDLKRVVFSLYFLLKFIYIKDSEFRLEELKSPHMDFTRLMIKKKCVCYKKELKKMELENMGHNHSLREFLGNYSLSQEITADYMPGAIPYDFDLLLQIRPDLKFPEYLDLIAARVGRKKLTYELHQMFKKLLVESNDGIKELYDLVNYDSLCAVANFLSDEDLFNWIIAFSGVGFFEEKRVKIKKRILKKRRCNIKIKERACKKKRT